MDERKMILTVTANPTVDKVYFVDEFKMGEVHRPSRVAISAGGKGINVARVAKELGQDVISMGFIGGAAGEFVKSETEKLGIAADYTKIGGETRTNVNISNSSGLSGELLESGPEVSVEEQNNFIEQYKQRVKESDIVCISGSLPRGVLPQFYCKLVKIAKLQNKCVIVDTSGDTVKEVLEEMPFMIKPNSEEIKSLLGYAITDNNDIKKALLFLKEKGVALPLISLGSDGAAALIEDKFYRFLPPSVEVKNAVGSGDSTVSGTAVGIARGYSFSDAVRLGVASGTANTQFEQTGFISKTLAEKYFEAVKVIEI